MDSALQLNEALEGRYSVEREIGAGGMATVYLARDLKHERSVALKVLKPELGAVLGVERFLSEIRVTANLQHPNLLPLFDSGEANGLLFYVMPFVDGETLRARLDREKQLPVDEAVRIASAVASALEYAHAHHVIHRDLKPENILIQGGQPVIADFGIALAVSNAGGARVTQTGLSLGTPQYMSPEQATGDRTIDARTDIYSLAAVTYEMLVGDPPHLGGTAQAIIAKVLTERPSNVRVARPSVPEHVAYAIEKGLEKLPADRWRSAAEFDAALMGKAGRTEASFVGARTAATSASRPSRLSRVLGNPLVGAALGLVAAAASVGWWIASHQTKPAAQVRLTVESPAGTHIATSGDGIAISPDGQTIVFVAVTPDGKRKLYVRTLHDIAPRELVGTEGATKPSFSPNGEAVVFTAGTQMKRIQIDGGNIVPLAEVAADYGASWGTNGTIVTSTGGHLGVVSENGGSLRLLPAADSGRGRSERYPLVLSDGETVLFTSWGGQAPDARLEARSLTTGAVKDLGLVGIISVVASTDGYLFYATSGGSLFAVAFDERALRITGEAQQVMTGIASGGSDHPPVMLSRSGSLVYQVGSVLREVVLADLRGNLRTVIPDQRTYVTPRLSPDGKKAAFEIEGRTSEIWVYDFAATGSWARLSASGTVNTRPEWTTDSKRVLYRSNRDGSSAIWWQSIDGSGQPEVLLRTPDRDVWECVISPDGQTLLFRTGTSGSADVWQRQLRGDTSTKPFVAMQQFTEFEARFSPDGKLVAYSSDELGARQVFVRQFPSGSGRVQVSTDGGFDPVWSADGRRLFYVRRIGQLMSARVALTPTFAVVARDTVAAGDFYFGSGHATYDVAPDGEHVLLLRSVATEVPTIVATGWLDEWRRSRKAKR